MALAQWGPDRIGSTAAGPQVATRNCTSRVTAISAGVSGSGQNAGTDLTSRTRTPPPQISRTISPSRVPADHVPRAGFQRHRDSQFGDWFQRDLASRSAPGGQRESVQSGATGPGGGRWGTVVVEPSTMPLPFMTKRTILAGPMALNKHRVSSSRAPVPVWALLVIRESTSFGHAFLRSAADRH